MKDNWARDYYEVIINHPRGSFSVKRTSGEDFHTILQKIQEHFATDLPTRAANDSVGYD